MWQFNVLVTMASDGRYRHLLDELAEYGEFHKTGFHGVALGRVTDMELFFEAIRQKRTGQCMALQDLARVVPLEQVFTFTVDGFPTRLCEALRPWIERLAEHRFYVRLERRGLKGQIISPDIEQALDAYILDELRELGHTARIDFEDPDAVVVIETVGDRCGVGLITRELQTRYDFVRVD